MEKTDVEAKNDQITAIDWDCRHKINWKLSSKRVFCQALDTESVKSHGLNCYLPKCALQKTSWGCLSRQEHASLEATKTPNNKAKTKVRDILVASLTLRLPENALVRLQRTFVVSKSCLPAYVGAMPAWNQLTWNGTGWHLAPATPPRAATRHALQKQKRKLKNFDFWFTEYIAEIEKRDFCIYRRKSYLSRGVLMPQTCSWNSLWRTSHNKQIYCFQL